MQKFTFISFIFLFCITSVSIAQNKVQGRLMIIGGIPDYDFPTGFENSCSKSVIQKAGSNIIKDVILSVTDNLSTKSLLNITLSKIDSSFNIVPLPFNNIIIYAMYDTPIARVVPADYYMFDKNGERSCEFQKYFHLKNIKFFKNQVSDFSLFSSKSDYILAIWPCWWYHVRSESSTVNENSTYWMVAFGLYSVKSGELIYSDSYWTKDKGKIIEYNKMVNKISENVSNGVVKYVAK